MGDGDAVRPWYRRKGAVAGLATAAVVAMVGGAVLLIGGESDSDPSVAGPTSTTTTTRADLLDLDDCREIEQALPDFAPPAPIGGGQRVRPPDPNTPETAGGEQPEDESAEPGAAGDAADSFGETFGEGEEAAVGDALCFRGHVVAVGDAVLEAGSSGDQVVVSVVLANRSGAPQTFGEDDWFLESEGGAFVAVSDEGRGRLGPGELGPGNTVHGSVTFDVGAGRHLVIYEPAYFEGARAVWSIDV